MDSHRSAEHATRRLVKHSHALQEHNGSVSGTSMKAEVCVRSSERKFSSDSQGL